MELKEKQLEQDLHYKTLVRLFVENRIYKRIEQAKAMLADWASYSDGFVRLTPKPQV